MVLHIAVVHTGDDICHITAATSPRNLADRLAEYVGRHLEYQLHADDARRVRSLLAEGRSQEAVSLYFARVGKWDPERLATRRLELSTVPVPSGT